jgi:rod shape-determining protein MreD
MALDLLHRLTMFLILLAAQVLILNHVHLLDVAMPLLYIYFAITFRRGFPRWIILLSCFFMGLIVDMFSSTPGLAAGTMTLVGFIQPFLVERTAPRDSAVDMEISAATLGYGGFAFLSCVITTIYCLVFFTLEAFSFFEWFVWLERIIASSLLTWILIMAIESVRSK